MDSRELHSLVHNHITKGGGTERTTDAVMWVVRAALRDKDVRIHELEAEREKLLIFVDTLTRRDHDSDTPYQDAADAMKVVDAVLARELARKDT